MHIGVIAGDGDRITAEKIIKEIENLTLYETDSDGNPIPETGQKLSDVATIELTPEELDETAEDFHLLNDIDGSFILGRFEAIDPEPRYDPKQKHYDETHSRKAKWHKRYF